MEERQPNIKEKSISGVLWVGFQKGSGLIIAFIANLILARLLSPEDYGCIGMLTIFIAVAQTFIDGGFGAALIQKKQPSETEYSKIFYFNLFISLVCYIVLFFSAPLIADFYRMPLLKDVLRIQGIILFFYSFALVQTSRMLKQLNFKVLSVVNIVSVIVGSILAVICAYNGLGVWSLVIKELTVSFITAVVLWIICKWIPQNSFSLSALKGMFGYSSMILLSSIMSQIYENIQGLIIGRSFSARHMGYYTQAKKIETIPSSIFIEVISKVTFPIFSLISDDMDTLKSNVRINIRVMNYAVFGVMTLLYILAEPLILLLFTDKWEASVPFFRILCLASMLTPLNTMNTQIFKAIGRSDIFFILQFVKRVIGICIILFSVRYGLMAMMWGMVVNAYVFYIMNIIFTSKYLNYTIKEQIGDILPNLSCCLIILFIFSFIPSISSDRIAHIVAVSILFVIIYVLCSVIMKLDGWQTIYKLLKNLFRNRYDKKNNQTRP